MGQGLRRRQRVSSLSTARSGARAAAARATRAASACTELLVGSDPIKKLIQEHARVAEILAAALNDGMRTLKQDGMEKVLQGCNRHASGSRRLHQVSPSVRRLAAARPDR